MHVVSTDVIDLEEGEWGVHQYGRKRVSWDVTAGVIGEEIVKDIVIGSRRVAI